MNARDLIYSTTDEESGIYCGKMQTVFFKLPGKSAAGPAGWQIRGKLTIYTWLGIVKHKKFFFSGLPRGFELSQDLRNAERPRALAPTNIHYLEKHVRHFHLSLTMCSCHATPLMFNSSSIPFIPFADFSAACSRLSGEIANWLRCQRPQRSIRHGLHHGVLSVDAGD
jgi:hypothetical protein